MKKEEFYKDAIPDSKGPLEGIRVLEATTHGAGPWAGTVLVDLGAESIKVDMPGVGDIIRSIPPFVENKEDLERGMLYLSINRNKKGITLNLKVPAGQEIFRELAKKMDIVIQNFKPGTMDKWNLGYKDIKKVKPDIIYTSISAYGQFGPYSHKAGADPTGQAVGGFMSVTGFPENPPTRAGFAIADNLAGWQGAFGSMAALHYKNKTGKGQHVDISLVDSVLYISEIAIMGANAGYKWQRFGNRYFYGAPGNAYKCKDGYVFFSAIDVSHWIKFCKIIEREDLIDDPRTNTANSRFENVDFVDEVINEWMKEKNVDEVVGACEEAQLIVAPVLNFDQIIKNEHILDRDMVAEVKHPVAGKLRIYGTSPKFSLTSTRVRTAAPTLGQHNEEVYGGLLGYSKNKVAELKEKKVI